MILPLLLATPVDAQITSRLYNQCNPTTEPFNWELPSTLCEQNPNFTPDITVGSDIYSVTFASQLSIPYSQTWGNPAWQYQDITIHGRLVLDTGQLPNGVYFVLAKQDGLSIQSARKLLIHR